MLHMWELDVVLTTGLKDNYNYPRIASREDGGKRECVFSSLRSQSEFLVSWDSNKGFQMPSVATNNACLTTRFHSHFLMLMMQKWNLIYMLNIIKKKRPQSSSIAVMTDPDLSFGNIYHCVFCPFLSEQLCHPKHCFEKVHHIIWCTREIPQRSD